MCKGPPLVDSYGTTVLGFLRELPVQKFRLTKKYRRNSPFRRTLACAFQAKIKKSQNRERNRSPIPGCVMTLSGIWGVQKWSPLLGSGQLHGQLILHPNRSCPYRLGGNRTIRGRRVSLQTDHRRQAGGAVRGSARAAGLFVLLASRQVGRGSGPGTRFHCTSSWRRPSHPRLCLCFSFRKEPQNLQTWTAVSKRTRSGLRGGCSSRRIWYAQAPFSPETRGRASSGG